MFFKKYNFGPSGKCAILSVDEQMKLVAVATICGSITIYSQVLEAVHRADICAVLAIEFVKGKGCLVVYSDDNKFHIMSGEGFNDSSLFRFIITAYDVGMPLSLFHICQNMACSLPVHNMIPLLTVGKDDSLELLVVGDIEIIRTSRTATRLLDDDHSNHILQIAETEYKDEKVTVVVLWRDSVQVVRFRCRMSDPASTGSVIFELDHIVCSYRDIGDLTSVSVIDDLSLIVATSLGQYVILRYNRDDHNLVLEETMFPYGPFPCKSITKCQQVSISGTRGDSYIFTGGLPAVTYGSLNTLSVATGNEPEICFTFFDPIIDFDVIHRRYRQGESMSRTIEEIVVLTESQLTTIINNNGEWTYSNICHLSPLSRSEVLNVSNIIEKGPKYGFPNGRPPIDGDDCPTKFLTTFHNDTRLMVWRLFNDSIAKHTEIDLGSWFQDQQIKVLDKPVLWPRFQKCGVWKNATTLDEFKINHLKLIPNNDDSFHVLFTVDDCQIFCLKIFYNLKGLCHVRTIETSCRRKYVSVIDTEDPSTYESRKIITENISNVPSIVELVFFVTLNGRIVLSNVYLDDSVLTFGGSDGLGLIDINSWKYFYISSDELSEVESSQSKNALSELILNRLRKQTYESSNLRKSSDCKSSKIKISKWKPLIIECFHLYRCTDSTFDLLIGFHNSLIMILSLATDHSGDIIVSSTYRRIASRNNGSVLSLSVLRINAGQHASSPLPLDVTETKSNSEGPRTVRSSVDSAKGSSPSTCSKSTTMSNGSNRMTTEEPKMSSLSKRLSLKWSMTGKNAQATDLFLIRYDSTSVKVIDYLKLKTRSKLKLKDQYKKSDILHGKIYMPIIIQLKVVMEHCVLLLCTPNEMKKFSIPNLEPISSIDIEGPIPHHALLSVNEDIIVIGVNESLDNGSISELVVLAETAKTSRRRTAPSVVQCSSCGDIDSTLVKFEGDHEGIDFMRCAEPSINSLLW